MKDIYKKLRLKQTVPVFMFALLSLWVASIGFARLNAQQTIQSIDGVRNHILRLSEQVRAIPDPKTIELGQRNSSLEFSVNQSKTIAGSLTEKEHELPTAWRIFMARPLDRQLRQSITETYKEVDQINTRTTKLLHHHSNTLKALQSLLEYNPRADLGSSVSTQEVDARIDSAHQGITEAQNKLATMEPYSDNDDLSDLTQTTNTLLDSLERFRQTHNKEAWFDDVERAQSEIVQNRHSFWSTELDALLTKRAELNQDLSQLAAWLR